MLNNLSPERQTIALDLTEREIATTTDLLADRRYEPLDPKTQRMRINGFGYRWLRLGGVYLAREIRRLVRNRSLSYWTISGNMFKEIEGDIWFNL